MMKELNLILRTKKNLKMVRYFLGGKDDCHAVRVHVCVGQEEEEKKTRKKREKRTVESSLE